MLKFRWVELACMFVLLPLTYLMDFHQGMKVGLTVVAFGWAGFCSYRMGLFRELSSGEKCRLDWKGFLLRLALGFLGTFVAMIIFMPEDMFVIFKAPKLLLGIIVIYSFVSVPLQELVYRPFFFAHFEGILPKNLLMQCVINGALFSLAHTFFLSPLVLVFTFLGGVLFSSTWLKTRSFSLVCLEHALYGVWLFILGIGRLLAFPMPT